MMIGAIDPALTIAADDMRAARPAGGPCHPLRGNGNAAHVIQRPSDPLGAGLSTTRCACSSGVM
jgi:hypothetical protein